MASTAITRLDLRGVPTGAPEVKEVSARAIAELESAGALRRERGHVHFLDWNTLLEYVV
ncbi:MAG: hypothetical protein M3N19_07640 [Candidatus Eremiobacteraeota bacterium]|nr:hypothetical protein [Candidatus Eremiobacteraeota bacterium]